MNVRGGFENRTTTEEGILHFDSFLALTTGIPGKQNKDNGPRMCTKKYEDTTYKSVIH